MTYKQTYIQTDMDIDRQRDIQKDRHAYRQKLGEPRREKTCVRKFTNNKGADRPAHPRSLISAFVIRFLESAICKLAAGKFSIF